MAYPFFPAGYQPVYQQNYQNQQNVGLQWVQGEAAAKSYPVAPNQTVTLWDSEQNCIYLKSADASGMPSMKVLDYVIRDNAPKSPEISPENGFATKDDVLNLRKEIDALKAKFSVKENGKEEKK